MPKYRVLHKNQFKFEKLVSYCQLQTRLTVSNSKHQNVIFKQFIINPNKHQQTETTDQFGNVNAQFTIDYAIKSLVLTTIHTVVTQSFSPLNMQQSVDLNQYNAKDLIEQNSELSHYFKDSQFIQYNETIKQYAQQSFKPNKPILESCIELNTRIYNDFKFDPTISNVNSTAIDCFENQGGVCQDFSHLAIACLRSVGLIAKYISGYVDTKVDSQINYVPSKDVSHAWFALFEPIHGWIEFDPTNNCLATDRYIRLAFGNDYEDVCPLQGEVNTQGGHSLKVSVDVERLN
ncbi:transglutaminase family protein [Marinicellulosiphila megalodicopiae]|uniref:transglutaminase family protein n=1 Tax=Marinicellulosiphila megalodicopiae TaxID=2724896 RepID=UPI003BB0F247